jgi:hypothetical protein
MSFGVYKGLEVVHVVFQTGVRLLGPPHELLHFRRRNFYRQKRWWLFGFKSHCQSNMLTTGSVTPTSIETKKCFDRAPVAVLEGVVMLLQISKHE